MGGTDLASLAGMAPPFRDILVPTDLSADANVAFAHALRLAVAARADLDVFQVERRGEHTPNVAATLARWDFVRRPATARDVEELGVHARRTMAVNERPDGAILDEMAATHADLVVFATHGRSGLDGWLRPGGADPTIRKRAVPMLLLPPGAKGFVDVETGETTLRRLLLPVDHTPDPRPGFEAAVALARTLGSADVEIATLHVGESPPDVSGLAVDPGWKAFHWTAGGNVVDEILATAATWSADVIVTVSEGRRSFLDNLRGSTMERLARRTRTPLMVVPADWRPAVRT